MKTLILAALVAAGIPAMPALAQDAPRNIAVAYGDLDLGTAEGRARFDLRVLHAARAACGTPSSADLRGRIKQDECVAEIRAAAAPQREALVASASRRADSAAGSR
ncbi:MAG: UrcA family protein [Sphingosinicella sp.]|uniref:UrcA family protein n=1 Tax=Sphingosinicella sp. TaxID=1917971 RepID=UPI004037C008